MDECYRLNIKAQSFVFLLSKLKERRVLEAVGTSRSPAKNDQANQEFDDDLDEDMDDGVDGLSVGPFRSLVSTLAVVDLDPDAYPTLPDFLSFTIPALVAAYEDRNMKASKNEICVSRPLLVKSLIQYEFRLIEKRLQRQLSRKPQSPGDVTKRMQLVEKHIELEEKCLRVIAECEKEITKEKMQFWNDLVSEAPKKKQGYMAKASDLPGAEKPDGLAGLGFVERWFA